MRPFIILASLQDMRVAVRRLHCGRRLRLETAELGEKVDLYGKI